MKNYEEVKDKLEEELCNVDWLALEPHLKREALFFVDTNVDIVEVAAKVAIDDKDFVKNLLDEKKLYKPMIEDVSDDKSKQYLFLIVQPFVFAQEILN